MTKASKVRPARKLFNASAKCSKEGFAYGQCVLKTYSTISHHSCQAEFQTFMNCVSSQTLKK